MAEVRDIIKKYVGVLLDFDRLNNLKSIREEICLKEVYLLLLNLKNPSYDRTLNPHKLAHLFDILDINLTNE